jgi:hypothetical protein
MYTNEVLIKSFSSCILLIALAYLFQLYCALLFISYLEEFKIPIKLNFYRVYINNL